MKFLLVIALVIGLSINAHSTIIKIYGQDEFRKITNNLNEIIERGEKRVVIKVSPGTYYYSQSMISLSAQNDDLSLSIIGKNVTLVPNSFGTKNLNPSCIQFQGENTVNLWSDVVQSPELISVVDETKKLCRIRIANEIGANVGDYIQISQWYKSLRYKVVTFDGDYIYFTADDLVFINEKSEWSVNYDYIYAKKLPRYRVFSVDCNKGIQQSSITTFIDISHVKVKDITIKGISFMGSAGSINSKGVINLNNVSAEKIIIDNCQFTECRSSCIKLENTSNLNVNDCKFYKNYTTCVSIGANCNNALITNNLFEDNGKEWNNSHVVLAKGADFLISDNVFRNFCYGAIGAGIWYKHKNNAKVSGMIADNEIYYTKEYNKHYLKHTLMDSGAIYLWTQMDDVTIKHNYIHDISGVQDNRGIFCDDGAKNVKIINNLILRIGNCYCIDLREVPSVAEFVSDCNTGNLCFNNLLDGTMRFFIKDESCKEYNNKVLGKPIWKFLCESIKWRIRD